jgi:serine/threonine protein kinase
MKKVKLGKFNFNDPAWKGISDQCKDFISKLLTLDQNKRPSAEEALKHPWIEQANKAVQSAVNQDVAINSL